MCVSQSWNIRDSKGISHCFRKADLCLCLGTSLQIRPCRDLPRKTKKNGGKIVIVNLQKTSLDSLADLIIHERCDKVMKYILTKLNLELEENSPQDNQITLPKYAHVKKLLLFIDHDDLQKKLAERLSALSLHIDRTSSDPGEDPTLCCRMMMEKNDALCSTHSIWIVADVQHQAEIDFFKQIFNDRVLLIRIEDSNETSLQIDGNLPRSFVFSKNDDINIDEQMNNLMKIIDS